VTLKHNFSIRWNQI